MRVSILSLVLMFVISSFADEMRPTSITPSTQEQIKTHKEVSKNQRALKKKLINKESPEEIHKAKVKVQESRVDANKADAIANE